MGDKKILDFEFWDGEANVGFWVDGAWRLNLGAARRSAPTFWTNARRGYHGAGGASPSRFCEGGGFWIH